MGHLKIVVWGNTETYRKIRMRKLLTHVEVCAIVDRNPEKGTPPERLCDYEFDFVLICSERFNDEIHRELLKLGIEEKRIIPAGYGVVFLKYLEQFDNGVDSAIEMLSAIKRERALMEYGSMQLAPFKKYAYFSKWESALHDAGKVQVICNWFHNGDTVSSIILIRRALGKKISISAFAIAEQEVIVADLRVNSERLRINLAGKVYGSGTITSDTEELLLKISCKSYDVPHIVFDIGESAWYQRLESEVANHDIRRNFELFMNRYSTYFSAHEEDYLLFRNFEDVKDMVIVDCGANYGQSICSFLSANQYVRVFSFEADPQLICGLRIIESYTDRLKVFNVGIGAKKGVIPFYYQESCNSSGSFIREDLRRRLGTDEGIRTVSVAVERLDDILPEDIAVHFAKFDIEGLEYDGICGMTKRIKRDHPVLLIEKNQANEDKIRALLKDDYDFYYYDYVGNCLVSEDGLCSLNYWALPKCGTVSPQINHILSSLVKSEKSL